jgi:antitoxin component YwqK of YwqJK toxin-antitoxin module
MIVFKLLTSAFKRILTAVTSPFRMMLVKFMRLFNINILTAKLIAPLTKQVKSLITLRPQSPKDYVSIGPFWVYKKLFATLVLVACAGVFLYFTMIASKVPTVPAQQTAVETAVSYDYDDLNLSGYTGVANIRAADGKVVYTGDIKDGVCTGTGKLWDRKGRLVYEGDFVANQYSGKGVRYYPGGAKEYEGEFADNQYSGAGTLYAESGAVLYTGSFAAGLYDGDGKLYAEDGTLLYEGAFSAGQYHGTGTSYYADGTICYAGEFFDGQPQGTGTLYSAQGRALYTGAMYAGAIDYRALAGATLAEAEAAFTETPHLYYAGQSCAFAFEQAGVILTVNCQVKVDTWENEASAASDSAGTSYYLPAAAKNLQRAQFSQMLTTLVIPGSSSSQSTSAAATATPSPAATATPTPSATAAPSASSAAQPDFVEKNQTLYFEIDTDVWQSEAELDTTKLKISRVTVLGGDVPGGLPEKESYLDDAPLAVEDCAAIELLRQDTATLFPNVVYTMDTRNQMYAEVRDISYAAKVVRRVYEVNGLTYTCCCTIENMDTVRYFIIEK